MKKRVSEKRLREIFKEELRSIVKEVGKDPVAQLGAITDSLQQLQSSAEPPSDQVIAALEALKQQVPHPSHLKYLEGLIDELQQSKATGTPVETNTMMGLWDLEDHLAAGLPSYKGTFN